MSCCGGHTKSGRGTDSPFYIAPEEPCVLCAEKHLATAYALACESGYATPNRQRIIGELVAAQWHLFREHGDLAMKIRAMRHLAQRRNEEKIDWLPALAEIDRIAAAEART